MSLISYLNKGLSSSPVILKRMLSQINPACYEERITADRFTLREVVAHLADFEPVILSRMEQALKSPGSEIQSWDEHQNSIDKNYKSIDVEISLNTYIHERTRTSALFASLGEEELKRTIIHPAHGKLSIYNLGVFALAHDQYHLEQVSNYFSY